MEDRKKKLNKMEQDRHPKKNTNCHISDNKSGLAAESSENL